MTEMLVVTSKSAGKSEPGGSQGPWGGGVEKARPQGETAAVRGVGLAQRG